MSSVLQIQQIAGTDELMHINGSVLRTLNAISGGKCRISDIEYIFSRINHHCLLNSLKYLVISEYIQLKSSTTGSRAELDTERFYDTYAVLTGKGVLVLQGFLDDECIEV